MDSRIHRPEELNVVLRRLECGLRCRLWRSEIVDLRYYLAEYIRLAKEQIDKMPSQTDSGFSGEKD